LLIADASRLPHDPITSAKLQDIKEEFSLTYPQEISIRALWKGV
jgi:hypothetical protein